jgi:hypothetical protein
MPSTIRSGKATQPRTRRGKPDPVSLQRELRRLDDAAPPPKPPHPAQDPKAVSEPRTDFHASLNGDP